MAKAKDYILIAFIIGVCILAAYPGCLGEGKLSAEARQPAQVEYFKTGDILPPDMVCSDTLVVVDAAGLNVGFGLVEQGVIDATDYQIDSIFHVHCKIK